jgi:hypothetical protein
MAGGLPSQRGPPAAWRRGALQPPNELTEALSIALTTSEFANNFQFASAALPSAICRVTKLLI